MKNTTSIQEMVRSLGHLLLPRLCAGCMRPLLFQENVLCLHCTLELPQTGFHELKENEAFIRIAGRFPFEHATAFAWFQSDGLMQHLMHLLKYEQRKDVGRFLGQQAAATLRDVHWMNAMNGIIPVPLHSVKLASRGYNQAELIARSFSSGLAIPMIGNAIHRIQNTSSQTRMNREERTKNVAGAFAAGPGIHNLAGKHILLMDDVLTTGATLEAAAQPLLAVPGIGLSIFTLGIAT